MKIVVNKSPVDQFTLVHALMGVLARRVGLSFQTTLGLGFLWDYVIEPAAKTYNPVIFPHPSQDAPVHMFIDAVTPAAAWLAYDTLLGKVR